MLITPAKQLNIFVVLICASRETGGFETGRSVTVKISLGCIVLMAEDNEVQALREQLYQAKQVVKGIKDGVFNVLDEG